MSEHDDHKSDGDWFREATRGAKPLRSAERSDSKKPSPKPPTTPRAQQSDARERAVIHELLDESADLAETGTDDELLFLRPGVQKRYLTRLRRGQYSVGDRLDLHQMNQATAADAVHEFVDQSIARGLVCVHIIHGKGLRSPAGPKLKTLTRRLLSRHPRVLAFASCRPVDGGTGAVAVLLSTQTARA